MLYAVVVILVVGLAVALEMLRRQRRDVRNLGQAIAQRQPLLPADRPGAAGPPWAELCASVNRLISESTQLRQQGANQLAQLEATLVVDANNYVLLANGALQAIFPGAGNILHQRLELILHSREFLAFVEAVRAGQAQPQQAIEFVAGTESTWVEATGALIPPLDGQKGAWTLFVLHDITRQKKLEAVRKDFVANVSHELRTPLSIIKGYVETLVDGHHDMPVADREKFLQTVQRHTERLNSLLDDLLTLSRLESMNPGLHCESTDLARLIAGAIEDYRSRPAAAQHRLEFSADAALPDLLIDPLKVSQVLGNLLDNALKYTPKGTHIVVTAKRQGAEIEVGVRDNGPGIPAEDLPHLFERFYRVDKGRSREKGGTGLGLSIVKHIVQLHGGRVRVESTLGQGTAFYFSLPV
jgi:two-component system phosphate regulon sensor histidine kinase PhoR